MSVESDSWVTLGHYVLEEIKRLSENDEKHFECERQHEIDLAILKIKSGIWGFIAGLIPAVVALIWFIVKR